MPTADGHGGVDLARRVVEQMMGHDAFSQWLGIEVLDVGPGRCTLRMTVRPEMTNGFGVSHGGIAFSLADSALAFASNSYGRVAMSVDANIGYPARINVGDVLTATAEQIHNGGRVGSWQVRVESGNAADGATTPTLVALFRGTVYRTSQDHFPAASGTGE